MDSETSLDEFVITTIAATCSVERREITPESSLADLLMDSLSIAALVSEVEAACSCEFSEDEIFGLYQARSVRDVLELIRTVTGGAQPRRLAVSDR